MTELLDEISAILKAADEEDMDALYDYRASIISTYAQAIAEFHFEEDQLEWLNELLQAVEDNDINGCRKVLSKEQDTEFFFLGTQFVTIMAGCFHHDELMTVVQAMGIKALLDEAAKDYDGPVN